MNKLDSCSYPQGYNIEKDDLLERIKSFCKAKHGRVKDLATAIGCTAPEVSRWFTGGRTPRPETLAAMSAWMDQASRESQDAEKMRQQNLRNAINSLRRPK